MFPRHCPHTKRRFQEAGKRLQETLPRLHFSSPSGVSKSPSRLGKGLDIYDPGNTFLSKKHKTGEQRQDWRSNSSKALNRWSLEIVVQRVWGLHIDAENRAILLSAISSVMEIIQEAKPDKESSNPQILEPG